MNNRIFLWAMHHAAPLLFWIAVLASATTFFAQVSTFLEMQRQSDMTALRTGVTGATLLASIGSALSVGVWPLIGAALIWRFDRRWSVEAEATE